MIFNSYRGQSSYFLCKRGTFLDFLFNLWITGQTGSDVERRTRKTYTEEPGCATKKLFVSRVVLKYRVGLTLKIPLKTSFLPVSSFSVRFFT